MGARVCHKCVEKFLKLSEKRMQRLERKSEKNPLVCVLCGCTINKHRIKEEQINFKK